MRRKLWMAVCAVLVVCGVIFPDIVFFNRTLQPSNILSFISKPADWRASSALLPVWDQNVLPSDGYGDLNSALNQFEPAHYFMARNFRSEQSPWWNPYSASGTLGPETLVDVKFSPHTLITAGLFDASPMSFDFGLLAIYCLGFYFMLRICLDVLQTNLWVGLLGAAVYLLNGFAVPNLNTGIGQPYFLFPIVLFSLLRFGQHRDLSSWLLVVLAHVIIMLANIMTTMMLTLLAVHALGLAFYFGSAGGFGYGVKKLYSYFFLITLAVASAFVLLGFLWFPVVHSFFVSDIATDFEARKLPRPVGIENLLSIFTPEHFWDFFGHQHRVGLYPNAGLETKTPRFSYLGMLASVVAVCAIGKNQASQKCLAAAGVAIVVFSYARVFGLASFVDHIPVLHSIGNQYWGCAVSVVLPLLVVIGVNNIRERKTSLPIVALVLSLQAVGFLYLYYRLGLPSSPNQLLHVRLAAGWWLAAVLCLLAVKYRWFNLKAISVFMAVALLVELFSYMNTVRPIRYGITDTEPGVVQFLRKNIDDGRILNVGQQGVLYPEYGALFGIRQAGTMNAGLLPWYEKFFEKHFGNDTFFFLALDGSSTKKRKKISRKAFNFDAKALDAASIKYIVLSRAADASYAENLRKELYPLVYSDGDALVFENPDYLPSLSLVGSLSSASMLDPHRTAITEDQTLLAEAKAANIPVDVGSAMHTALGTVDTVSVTNTEVVARVMVSQPAVLVLSDTWHPSWRATVDGKPTYLGRVNEAFRGMVLPAGKHEVRIFYDLPALRYGMVVSMAAGFIFVMLSLWALLGRRFFYERRTSNAGTISHLS
ncbi:MAG: YfhO family protein [Pseudomonadales bacterium]